MKILKEHYESRFAYGVKYKLFTILYSSTNKKYNYYLNSFFTKKIGDVLIRKSINKSKILNKYTLSVLGVIYTLYKYFIKYPFSLITFPFYLYIDGFINFVKNTAWYNNVRYFNWVNILIIIILILFILIKN